MALAGCGGKTDGKDRETEELTFPLLSVGEWRDNTLDPYYGVVKYSFSLASDRDVSGGGSSCLLQPGKALYFRKYLYTQKKKNMDLVETYDVNGKKTQRQWEYGKSGNWNDQVWQVGYSVGKPGYLFQSISYLEDGSYQSYITHVNEELQEEASLCIPSLCGDEVHVLDKLMGDGIGRYHGLQTGEGGSIVYSIFSQTGEEILTRQFAQEEVPYLEEGEDGLVEIVSTFMQEGKKICRRIAYDAELQPKEETYEIPVLAQTILRLGDGGMIYHSKDGLVYCSPGGQEEILYQWKNHGIMPDSVPRIMGDMEHLELICQEDSTAIYLVLEPVTEKEEIKEITLAVAPENKITYEKAVAMFHKRYPGYHIELSEVSDPVALRTQLMAGEGPVLIDTALTGFQDLVQYWQPLDTLYEQLGLEDEILPIGKRLGMIRENQYGVCTSFTLGVFATYGREAKNWNYEDFIEELENAEGLEAISSGYTAGDGLSFVMNYMYRDGADSYFLEDGKGLNKKKLEKLLDLTEKYCKGKDTPQPTEGFAQGKVLGNALDIERPEQLALYLLAYGEEMSYSGFPAKNGGTNYVYGNAPLTIRISATDEEKGIGATFMGELLSYESQSAAVENTRLPFSVRSDVLEEQIAAVNANTPVSAPGFETAPLGKFIPAGTIRTTLDALLEHAECVTDRDEGLRQILLEELSQYFDGRISRKQLIDHLENRVQLYMKE